MDAVRTVLEDSPGREWTIRQIQEMCPAFTHSQINDAIWTLCQRRAMVRVNGKQQPDGRGWNPVERIYRYVR